MTVRHHYAVQTVSSSSRMSSAVCMTSSAVCMTSSAVCMTSSAVCMTSAVVGCSDSEGCRLSLSSSLMLRWVSEFDWAGPASVFVPVCECVASAAAHGDAAAKHKSIRTYCSLYHNNGWLDQTEKISFLDQTEKFFCCRVHRKQFLYMR